MPASIEPPVSSPRDLAAAVRGPRPDRRRRPSSGPSPAARTSWSRSPARSGEPPDRLVDLWALDDLRGITTRWRRHRPRRPDDVHGHPPLGALPRAPARARRGGRDDRRGADPEPRHARRQHRQRVAGRRHAARPARADAVFVLGSARGERTVAATDVLDRLPADRPRRRTSSSCASGSRSSSGREMRFRKVGTRRAQAISKVVLASPGGTASRGAWRDVRIALGSVAATPIRAAATEAVLEGTPADARDRRSRRRDAGRRAAADRRRPLDGRATGGWWRRGSCTGSSARRGGW